MSGKYRPPQWNKTGTRMSRSSVSGSRSPIYEGRDWWNEGMRFGRSCALKTALEPQESVRKRLKSGKLFITHKVVKMTLNTVDAGKRGVGISGSGVGSNVPFLVLYR